MYRLLYDTRKSILWCAAFFPRERSVNPTAGLFLYLSESFRPLSHHQFRVRVKRSWVVQPRLLFWSRRSFRQLDFTSNQWRRTRESPFHQNVTTSECLRVSRLPSSCSRPNSEPRPQGRQMTSCFQIFTARLGWSYEVTVSTLSAIPKFFRHELFSYFNFFPSTHSLHKTTPITTKSLSQPKWVTQTPLRVT